MVEDGTIPPFDIHHGGGVWNALRSMATWWRKSLGDEVPRRSREVAGRIGLALALCAAPGLPAEARAQAGLQDADALSAPRPAPTRGPASRLTAPTAPPAGVQAAAAAPGSPGSRAPGPRQTPDRVHLDLAAGTHAPVSVGAEATLELPGRLLLQLHSGWLPPAYFNLMNDVADNLGAYDAETAALVEDTMEGSFVLRPAAGWRPFPSSGLELWVGYTHVRLRGRTTTGELQDAGVMDGREIGDARIPLSSRLHAVTAGVGWRWVPSDSWVLRLGLAYTNVLASEVGVSSRSERANRQASERLEDIFDQYVQTVELRLTVGFRL